MQASFQTRLRTGRDHDVMLDRWGELYGRVQHQLFDAYSKTGEVKALDKPAAQARRLSSFAYGAIQQALDSYALLRGVPMAEVNPAYTSVIGRVKYAKPLGVSVHQAAALASARRGMGYREAALVRPVIPDGKGDHLVVELAVRNRSMHAWSHWAKVRSKVQGTLAGWHRLRSAAAREDAGWPKARRASSRGQSDAGAVKARPSDRQPNRSAGVGGTRVHGN